MARKVNNKQLLVDGWLYNRHGGYIRLGRAMWKNRQTQVDVPNNNPGSNGTWFGKYQHSSDD